MIISKRKLLKILHAQIDELEACIAFVSPDMKPEDIVYNEGAFDAYMNVLLALEDKHFRNMWESDLRDSGWLMRAYGPGKETPRE